MRLLILEAEKVEIIGALDGQQVPLAQYEPGVTVPPFHPRCRCTTAPVVSEAFAGGVRIARDETGQQYTVPAGTRWKEWKMGGASPDSSFHSLNLSPEPVTMQSVSNVKAFKCETLDSDGQRQLQNAHKRLLVTALKRNENVEVGIVFDTHMKPLAKDLAGPSDGGSITLPNQDVPYVAVHTHPDCSIFSHGDLLNFANRDNLKLLTAIGHN